MIQKHTCKNGMRIVLENVSSVRSVTIGVWVLTGSRHEQERESGISHFIEHMLFKGTKTRSAVEIAEGFESIGGQVNAFTSKEYTCYYAKVLDSYKEHALDILQDMFFHSTFADVEMDKERKVITEEILMYEDAADELVHDLLFEAAFQEQPLGRNILGTPAHIGRFTKEDIHSYMSEHYVPENIVVSIAGNVDESFIHVVEQAFDQFADGRKGTILTEATFSPAKMMREKETEQAHVCIGYEGLQTGSEQMAALLVASNVLSGGMSSRLFQEIREEKGLAYAIYGYHSSYVDAGLFTIYAGTTKHQLADLQATIKETMDRFTSDGLTEKELRNSKAQIIGTTMIGLESTSSRMTRNGRNELLLGYHRSLDEIAEEIEAVGMAETKAVIEQMFEKPFAESIVMPKM